MDNPAEYMLQFFNCEEREEGFDDGISMAFWQMRATELCLEDLISMHFKRLDTSKSVLPGIWKLLWSTYAQPDNYGGFTNFEMHPVRGLQLDAAQQQALERIADKTPIQPMKVSADNTQSLNDLLEKVIKAARDDDSLPTDLRLFIIRVSSEVRRNLNEFEVGNDFELKDALQKLFGVLYVAETQTTNAGIWEKIKSSLMKPFIAGLLAESAKMLADGGADAVLRIASS